MMRIIAFISALLFAGLGATGARAQLISANDYWRYPAAASYTAMPNDSGSVFSAYNAGGSLTITLPANAAGLPSGWHIGVVNDNSHQVTVQVNATAGGQILYPAGHAVSSVTTATGNYEFLSLEYDNAGNFRIVAATPATATAIGIAGGVSCITGPGSSTDGYAVRWSGTSGCILAGGTPVGNSGANTILETDSSGHVSESVLYIDTSLGGHAVCWNGSNFYTSAAC